MVGNKEGRMLISKHWLPVLILPSFFFAACEAPELIRTEESSAAVTTTSSSGSGSSASASTTPTLTFISNFSGTEDDCIEISYDDVIANANESGGSSTIQIQMITLSSGTLATEGTCSTAVNSGDRLTTGNSWYWKPDSNVNGNDTVAFTVKAYDGEELSTTAVQVKFNITAQNDAPVASDASFSTVEDTVYNGTLSGSDADGDTLSFEIVSNGTNGTAAIIDVNAGTFSFTPDGGFTGSDSFTYKIWDGAEYSSTKTVTVTVGAVEPLSYVGYFRDDSQGGTADGLLSPINVTVSPEGHVYVTGVSENEMAIFTNNSGTLEFLTSTSTIFDATVVRMDSDGDHVYMKGLNGIGSYSVSNKTTGALSLIELQYQGGDYGEGVTDGLYSWGGLDISPDDANVYVTCGGCSHLATFNRVDATGELQYVEVYSSNDLINEGYPYVSPDGKHLYLTGNGGLMYFTRDTGTGLLTYETAYANSGFIVNISPDGKHLYIATGTQVKIYSRNAVSGALTLENTQDFAINAGVFNTDGSYLFTTDYSSADTVYAFTRNSTTGALTLAGTYANGTGGITLMGNIYSYGIGISQDDSGLYITSTGTDHTLSIFDIN